MTSIVYLNHWSGNGPAALTGGERPRAVAEPLYGLARLDLARVRALLVPANVDQRYLLGQRDRLEAWLLAGGAMVFNGHVAYPFLRWLRPFAPGRRAAWTACGCIAPLRIRCSRASIPNT